MRFSCMIKAAAVAGLLVAPQGADAQEATASYGGLKVTVGAGSALLTLPDVDLILRINNNFNTLTKFENNDISEDFGYSLGGAVEIPAGGPASPVHSFVVQGFFSQINDDDNQTCVDGGINGRCSFMSPIDRPGVQDKFGFSPAGSLTTNTDREVDHFGVAIEAKRNLSTPRPRYVSLGFDYRAINQDLDVRSSVNSVFGTETFNYSESLDTDYYGIFAAFGGDYVLPLVGNLTSGLGLQSKFRLWGGAYLADTDYSGSSTVAGPGVGGAAGSGALSLSSDDVAFIGGLTLETVKRIGSRTALSLRSDYTYYSWVPDMQYDDTDAGGVAGNTGFNAVTRIGDDDAFSMQTMLRLTIGLGPQELYTNN